MQKIKWEEYLGVNPIPPHTETKFFEYLKSIVGKTDATKMFEATIIKNAFDNSELERFTAVSNKNASLPLSQDLLKKSLFKYLLYTSPNNVEIDSSDDYRNAEIENFKILLIGSLGSNFGSKKNHIDSSETDGIREMIIELGSKCISTGFIPNEDLPNYLALTDIGVVPSLCEDVAPNSYLQFQVIGKPSIVSDGGGIPEFFSQEHSIMVSRGENMVEELKAAMVELILNKKKRKELGENAKLNCDYLSKERYFQDFSTIILNNY